MTATDLVFYTNPMSRGRIARWMLEETGAAYTTEFLDYGADMATDAYRAINPMSKVPAITHRGVVVTEAAAICAYLADAFPDANLAPALDDPQRGTYYRWLFFTAGPLEAAIVNKALGVEVPQERRGMVGYGSLERVTEALVGALSKTPFLCGDQFTAADVYVGAQIGWTMGFGQLEKRPVFEDYVARVSSRPAAVKARERDDAEIARRKALDGGKA